MITTVGDLFTVLLILLWIFWTGWTLRMFFKYRIKEVLNAPEMSFLEGLWWVANIILPFVVFICWLGSQIYILILENWNTTL